MKLKTKRTVIFGGISAGLLIWYFIFSSIFPMPRGERVNPKYGTYFKNIRGVYYISVDNCLSLINHGHFGYLENVDTKSFHVLSDDWAKDKTHIWYEDYIVKEADVSSFVLAKSGLPKDKYHVFVPYGHGNMMRPTNCGIDVETAEYFIKETHGWPDCSWMRDKDNVYLDEVRVDVDRESFGRFHNTYWWVDKNWIYSEIWDPKLERKTLKKVDSLQAPLDTLPSTGSHYLRNGRNVIYCSKVIVKGLDISRFEEVGFDKCMVNDMLFVEGKKQ